MKGMLMFLLLGFAVAGNAQQAYVTPKTQQGADEFDKEILVNQYYNECLDSVCMTSEDPNCTLKCRKLAKEKAESVRD